MASESTLKINRKLSDKEFNQLIEKLRNNKKITELNADDNTLTGQQFIELTSFLKETKLKSINLQSINFGECEIKMKEKFNPFNCGRH
jgi:hypothetical protein